jgi:predicted Zn-ribbon and HTH transcriptional regulator
MAKEKKGIGMVQLPGCRCRCGHEWLSREQGERPRVCPKCKSPNWDRPKKYERKS